MDSKKFFLSILIATIPTIFISIDLVNAHISFIAEDKHSEKENSLEIDDINISKLISQNITNKSYQSWIKFSGEKGENLYFQIEYR